MEGKEKQRHLTKHRETAFSASHYFMLYAMLYTFTFHLNMGRVSHYKVWISKRSKKFRLLQTPSFRVFFLLFDLCDVSESRYSCNLPIQASQLDKKVAPASLTQA